MKFSYFFLLALLPWAGWAAEQPPEVDPGLPYQKEALASSLRCLETSRGDLERISRLRCWVATQLAYLGKEGTAVSILRSSRSHYHIPSGCVESAMVSLGYGNRDAVAQLLGVALDLLPYAVGRGADLVQFQILRIATVTEDSATLQRAWEAEKLTSTNLQKAYAMFLQDWNPKMWKLLLDKLFPDRQWIALEKEASRDEEIAWKADRTVDYFSGLLFMREAEARVRSGKSYPGTWIGFVKAGIRAPAINTRPAGLSLELAELALLEQRHRAALVLVEDTWKLLGGWGPQMSGLYPIERDLALMLPRIKGSEVLVLKARERLQKRAEILCKNIDAYEQLVQLPLLAEGLLQLGDSEQATKWWRTAAKLCAENQNPESQSAGLTRIWMSYARANTWPDKETEAVLLKTEKQLPGAYSKVNF